MNHRLTITDSAFAAENIPDGQQILDRENDLNRKKTCVDADTIVFVSMVTIELLAAVIAASMLMSLIYQPSTTSDGNAQQIIALVAAQVVTALMAHSLALLSVCKSFARVLLFACTLNVIEIVLNVARLCWAGIAGESRGHSAKSCDSFFLLTP
jgi:hypothetical protein